MSRQKSALTRVQVRVSFTRQEMDALEGLLALGMFGTSVPEVVSRIVGADLDRRKRGTVGAVFTSSSGRMRSGMAGVRMRRADEVEMVDEHTMRERVIEPLRDHEPTAEEAREALKRRRPGSVQPTMAGVRAINEARALQSQDPVEQIVDAARRLALAKKVAAQTAAGAKTMDELEAEQAPWGVKEEE